MHGISRYFFTLAIVFALCGMTLGIHMGMTHDHTLMPVHAHTLVAGWLMSAVFAFFYHLVPSAGASRLAVAHFWLYAVASIGLLVSLFILLGGNDAAEPAAAVTSVLFLASMILFAFIALPAIWRKPA